MRNNINVVSHEIIVLSNNMRKLQQKQKKQCRTTCSGRPPLCSDMNPLILCYVMLCRGYMRQSFFHRLVRFQFTSHHMVKLYVRVYVVKLRMDYTRTSRFLLAFLGAYFRVFEIAPSISKSDRSEVTFRHAPVKEQAK